MFRDAKKWLLEAVFPARCLICRREGEYFCQSHRNFPLPPRSEAVFEFLDEIFAVTAYFDPVVERAVEFFKFRGFKDLGSDFAREIVDRLGQDFFKNAMLVPIPLHWTRRFFRGFNQSEILAKEIAKLTQKTVVRTDLRRIRRSRQQSKLSKSERIENVRDVFLWTGDQIDNREKIVIIDDVVATGSTIDFAARELKNAGAGKVFAVVFARGGGNRE